jgi:hypothetical protein
LRGKESGEAEIHLTARRPFFDHHKKAAEQLVNQASLYEATSEGQDFPGSEDLFGAG